MEFADAIAMYGNEYESEEGLFFLCSIKMVPVLRKSLGDYLKYTEGYIKTGYIGNILGVPCYFSKAINSKVIFLAHKSAVTAFFKKQVFVEQDRDIDTKKNMIVASRYTVIALTDESRCIALGKNQTTACAITTPTAGATTISGTCQGTDVVRISINGVNVGTTTAAGGAWSMTVDALKSGDKVRAVAILDDYLPSVAKVTVA